MEASQNGSSECGRAAQMWPSIADMQRANIPNPQEIQKMKAYNGQCGVYEGISMPVVNGHCQQSHGRLYPAYMQQQQQQQQQQQPNQMQIRGMHQLHHYHHHHPGSMPTCHPHPAQQPYVSAPTGPPVPHGHMMNGTPAVAPSQQMRPMTMNQYPPTTSYAYPHHSTASNSGYYTSAVTTNAPISGNGPCMDYSHSGHGLPLNSNAQFPPPQRTINTIPLNTGNAFRAVQNLGAHQSKVINSGQAAMYQTAYHQYTQFIQQQQQQQQQQHGIIHTHHQNGPTAAATNVPSNQQHFHYHQQSRLLQYMTKGGQQPVPQPHYNPVYPPSGPCHSHLMPNCATQSPEQQQPQLEKVASGHGAKPADLKCAFYIVQPAESTPGGNSKPKTAEPEVPVKERGLSSERDIVKASNRSSAPSLKIASKLRCRSPEKSVKIKATKSATKLLRDRQSKLVLGRKKKVTNINVVSSGKKLKSYLKASSSTTEIGSESSSLMKKANSIKDLNIECVHAEPLRKTKTRPPPGFEHLSRPAPTFPIELCDESLLGTLIGCQLSREGLLSESSKKSFGEDLQVLLSSLPCCDKGEGDFDGLWDSRKPLDEGMEQDEDLITDEWENLSKEIRTVVDEWTEELHLLGRFQIILHDDLALRSINLFQDF